jgi:SAM-dependent methyltransferase
MKPPIWQVYDWLQTDSAYPHGPMPAATCHVDTAARNGLRELSAHAREVLLVGPSTRHEYDKLRTVFPLARFTLLTCFAAELAGLADTGEVVLGDMHDTPFKSDSFDLVFSSNVLEHAFSPYGALLELRRVLKLGGEIYSVIPTFETDGGGNTPWHLHCMSETQWFSLLHKAGFGAASAIKVREDSVAGAEYHHISAVAVEPAWPQHAEALRRLRELKGG